jgi:mono/diheme cytochrome c family protein
MSRWQTRGILTLGGVAAAISGLLAQSPSTPKPIAPVAAHAPAAVDTENALIRQYCTTCHSDRMKTGGLTLASYDAAHPEQAPGVSEKIIRKLRAGMMPPAGVKRPEESALKSLAAALEARIDRAAALNPDPGHRPFQRLNRAEYARAVRDLLGLDVDVAAFLPPDTIAHSFDNISDEQSFSPALMEGYLRAASQISRLAIGDRNASAGSTIYHIPRTGSQMRRVAGAPIGTRGGTSVVHIFPADGEYVFKMLLHSGPTGDISKCRSTASAWRFCQSTI